MIAPPRTFVTGIPPRTRKPFILPPPPPKIGRRIDYVGMDLKRLPPKIIGKNYFPVARPPGMRGLGALPTSSILLGIAAVAGVYILLARR